MRTKFVITLIFILLGIRGMSQHFEWIRKYDSISYGELDCVIITTDKEYVASGNHGETGVIMKTDTAGNVLINKSFLYMKGIKVIQQTSDGGFAFYGSCNIINDGYLLVKTDSNFDTLWTATILHGYPFGDRYFQQTNDSGYVVLGILHGDTMLLNKLNSTGNLLWTKQFVGLRQAQGSCVCQTSDGGYLIGANTNATSPPGFLGQELYVIKTDSNGDTLWTYISATGEHHELLGAIETSDHNYAIIYYCGMNSYIRKINAEGMVLWNHPILTGSYKSFPSSISKTKDNGFIVAGFIQNLPSAASIDYAISKIDSLGIESWILKYSGSQCDMAFSVVQESDSVYISSGFTADSVTFGVQTLAKIIGGSSTNIFQPENEFILSSIYPNPAKSEFTITFPRDTKEIVIINSMGEIINNSIVDQQTSMNVIINNAGIYYVQIITKNIALTKKVVITR